MITKFMACKPVPAPYEAIAQIVRCMLHEARAHHWEKVAMLGTDYQTAVETLRDCADPGDDAERAMRHGLISRILEDDASLRSIISPEMDRLATLLGGMKRQQAVLRAYRQQSGL